MIDWIIQSRELIKIIYALIIISICLVIVLRTNKLFRLSSHQGIRYFRNCFLFFGFGFFVRYILGSGYLMATPTYFIIMNILFEFFLIMAGFFLVYSLLWKKFELDNHSRSSLFNGKIIVFYLMSAIIVLLDYLWLTHSFMLWSQIILFALAVIISFNNYINNTPKGKFLKYYFIAMLMGFIAWVLNFLAANYFHWDKTMLMGVYGLNILLFLLFLFGVIKVTRDR